MTRTPMHARPADTVPRSGSRLRAGALALGASGALLAGVTGASSPAQATTGTVYDVSTFTQLDHAVSVLKAGDTVKIEPGTYTVGSWRPRLGTFGHHAIGTAAAPIVVTAADPARPPLLVGSVKLDGPDYWRISNLRVQGTVPTTDTFTVNGGSGWSLMHSEIFGAGATGALANVVVAKLTTMPTNWTIADNAIHDGGANASQAGKQHEIYCTAVGNAGHALIVRNALYDTPEGAGVKLGNGGLVNSPGISGVQVTDNTLVNNFEQILLHGQVSNNTIAGNLLIRSTRALGNGATVGVYLAGVTGRNNLIKNNYLYSVTSPIYDNNSTGSYLNGGNNTIHADPRFDSATPWTFHPTTTAAQAYGRYDHTPNWH